MPDKLDEFITTASAALDLPLEQTWRPAIKANLEVTLKLANLVAEFPLPDEAEPALKVIEVRNPVLNAFTSVTAERARRRAKAIDASPDKKKLPLAGVPFAVKNLFDVEGIATVAGSRINRAHAPAKRDAELIERLEKAGAVLIGATNMGEYAYDFTGENMHDGPSRNPHDVTRMSGGSSGGSGSAVGGGMVPLALGSDTNGSIRVPSSLCGIFGLKPTYGRLTRCL